MNNLTAEFDKDISNVLFYIENNKDDEARYIFNSSVYEKYSKEMTPKSVLYFAVELWVVLDEYLNSFGARNFSTKEFLLSVYEEYKNDFKQIQSNLK